MHCAYCNFKQNQVASTVISRYDYSVNAIGQRTALAQTGTAFTGPKTIAWDYDSLGQVTLADVNGMGDRAYEYDAIGNRKKSAHNTLTLPATDNHTANALNQYTTVPGHTGAIVHDPDGNLTQGSTAATSNLLWDAENRLIAATNSSTGITTTYRYDAFSRRISRSLGILPTTLFIYDAWNCITEYQFHNSSFSLHTSYLWGMDLSGTMQEAGGVGGLLSQRTIFNSPAVFYYPCYDGNGNVTQYLTSTGSIATSFEYDPFGRLMINNFTNLYLPYRYSTKPLDQPTGLYYYGYRYYDPTTGRWPSRDPIGEAGGVNVVGFIGNKGLILTDFLGFWPNFSGMWEDLAEAAKFAFDAAKAAINGQKNIENTNKDKGDFYDDLADPDCEESVDELEEKDKESKNQTVNNAKKGGEIAGKALDTAKNLVQAAAGGYGIPTSVSPPIP